MPHRGVPAAPVVPPSRGRDGGPTLVGSLSLPETPERMASRGPEEETCAMEPPETHYAMSGDVHVAYQVLGAGPLDLVYAPALTHHVELAWENPPLAKFLRRLSSLAAYSFSTSAEPACPTASSASRRSRRGWTTFARSWTQRTASAPCSSAITTAEPWLRCLRPPIPSGRLLSFSFTLCRALHAAQNFPG